MRVGEAAVLDGKLQAGGEKRFVGVLGEHGARAGEMTGAAPSRLLECRVDDDDAIGKNEAQTPKRFERGAFESVDVGQQKVGCERGEIRYVQVRGGGKDGYTGAAQGGAERRES